MSERLQLQDVMEGVIDDALANIHTATIARVTAVGATTISCQPVIARVIEGRRVLLPEFTQVPPMFMQGGGSYTAHPIAVGDYALLIFTERCFDNWYNDIDNETPLEHRMHDYSDGFAIVGVNPLGSAIEIPTRTTQIGDTLQEGNYEHEGNRDQDGNSTINGNLLVNGNFDVNGSGGGGGVVTIDANIQQVTGRTLRAGNGVSGTFDRVTVVDGIVVGGTP